MSEIYTTGPIRWFTVDASDLAVGDIILVTVFDGHECYGIITRCYESGGGGIFCHVDIGLDSIPKRYEPEESVMIGRAV